jgi:hypothetical protein
MTIPLQVGWPQALFILIGLVGLWLFISAVMALLSPRRYITEDEKEAYRETRKLPRRRLRWKRGVSGIVLVALALSLLWVTFVVQTYLGLTGEIKVAHIRATSIANEAHELSVELVLYDGNGHATSDTTYLLHGDEWMIQGDILKIAPWLNVVGLHSGYKLTRLEGRYDNIDLENNARHTAIALNGGDDTFFQTMYAQRSWLSPFVDASYGNAVYQTVGSFDVFATQDALIARPGE